MSVIINNLDMVVQRQDEAAPSQPAKPQQPPATGEQNQDLRDTLRRQADRKARLRAY
jgi:hypothetical protein